MILHPGCKKALYSTSAIPLEAWGKDWTSRPEGLRHRGLIPNKMDNCHWHQQFPTWNLEKNSKKMWNCTLNLHPFPMWNLGTESRAGIFHSKIWKLQSERPRAWLQAESSASSIGSRQNHLPAQADYTGSLRAKWMELNLRGTYQWPFETVRKTVNLKSVHGTPRLFPAVPRCHWKFASVPLLPSNLLKNRMPPSKCENLIGCIQ